MDRQYVEVIFLHAGSKVIVEIRIIDPRFADGFIPSREIDADLRWPV